MICENLVLPQRRLLDTPKPASSLLLDCRGYPGSGATAYDHSRYRLHSTITDGAWVVDRLPASLILNGSSTTIDHTTSPHLNPAAITLETWVRFGALATIKYLFYKLASYEFFLWDNDYLYFRCFFTDMTDEATAGVLGPVGGGWVVDTWYHLVATYDLADLRVYVNGVERTSKSVSNSGLRTSTYHTWYGSQNGTQRYLHGRATEIRIYNTALSASAVKARYEATK